MHALDQLLEVGIIAGAQAEQADLVVAGVAVALEGRLHDGFDRADAQRPLDDGRLTEAALPGTAAHDLDGDAVVRRLHERDDRPRRQRDVVEVLLDGAGHDLARHVGARAVHGGEGAVGVILRLVEHRRVGPGRAADELGDHVGARLAAAFLERHPAFHDPRQALLAVADDEEVDERGEQLRVLRAGAAGDDERMVERAVLACSGMPPRSSMVRMFV